MEATQTNDERVRIAADTPGLGLRKGRVLVAEDDDDTRRLIARALRRYGYEVVEARNGVDLLSRIEATALPSAWREPSFTAIISDNLMPELSGLDVLGVLGCAHWRVPFIVMSAFADRETRDEARALGATAFLEKPFRIEELAAAVGAAARAH